MPQTPPSSMQRKISEPLVIQQGQVILCTILAGGAFEQFVLPPCIVLIRVALATFTDISTTTVFFIRGGAGFPWQRHSTPNFVPFLIPIPNDTPLNLQSVYVTTENRFKCKLLRFSQTLHRLESACAPQPLLSSPLQPYHSYTYTPSRTRQLLLVLFLCVHVLYPHPVQISLLNLVPRHGPQTIQTSYVPRTLSTCITPSRFHIPMGIWVMGYLRRGMQ